uniref:Translation initiation factor beta propellor-like domain-containing protein n=1 Tax=Alexandrium monilatum TaxID=311494 RepID=A0A7S4S1T1_9DINO
MEFVAVATDVVGIYSFSPAEEGPPRLERTFPAVRTAEGCVWSTDGSLLGLEDVATCGVTVYNAAAEYAKLCEVPPLIGGPVRNFYFSPLGNHLVTHERHVKDAGNNVGVWDARTGELRFSFVLKKLTEMSWPPLKWTSLETHCCRMVQDGVTVMAGGMQKEAPTEKISAAGIMAFEVAPRGAGTGPPHVAICIAESKGAPARCQIFRVTDLATPTATKTFFKAQTVTMQWNNTGTALLVRTSMEVDDTGKSYYGGSHLHFMRADGQESLIVASPDDGPIHDVQWSPTQDEFCLLHGVLPCNMTLHEGKKGQKRVDFGTGHRNTIRWNNFGRFLVLAGHGQLIGDTDFWDKPGKRLLRSVRMECCVVCGWAPDGRHFLGATTSPRMRVDNKVQLYDYGGRSLASLPFPQLLLLACWRPRPRGAFEDRPPSPGRSPPGGAGAGPGPPQRQQPQAYRPPAARGGGGGLAEQLRRELGSTSAGASATATRVGPGGAPPPQRLPPGCSPEDLRPASGAPSNSKAERKRRAREAAGTGAQQPQQQQQQQKQQASGALEREHSPAASASAPVPAAAAEGGQPVRADGAGAGGAAGGNAEVEKKVRALRKKLREIEKLKEKPDAELEPLQRQKMAGEADIVRQIRELGSEP